MTPRRHACAMCIALQQAAVRRRDPELAEAAIRLRDQHAENDAERDTFSVTVWQRLRGQDL